MQSKHKLTSSTQRNGKVNASAENQKYVIQASHDTSQNDSFMNEIDSEAEPAFETKNYLFELQSRCNTLEYEKTKIAMTHQNMLSELRHKNDYLETLAGNLSIENQQLTEEADTVKRALAEVREQNHEFSKQINSLKIQLELLNKTQLDNQSINSQDVDRLNIVMNQLNQKVKEVESKNQEINRLQKELNHFMSAQRDSTAAKVEPSLNYKQSLGRLQRQRSELTQQLEQANQKIRSLTENESQQLSKHAKQKQQLSKQIHQKQAVLMKLERENASLKLQIDKLKQDVQLVENKSTLGNNEQIKKIKQMMASKEEQLIQTENQVISFQNKVNELEVEIHRLKCQKNGVEQYNKYLQKNNAENEEKRKNMQQQIYSSERKISELKAFIFNQKLANQKMINNLKLQFEEEKIKNIEQIQEKTKQIYKLKEMSLTTKRQNKDLEDINLKIKSLSKVNQENAALKSENIALKQKLKMLEDKSEKLSLKQNLQEKQTRSELDKRVESLQKEINKLKTQNLQFQHPKQYNYQQLKTASILQPASKLENNSHLIQALELSKIDKRQKEQIIRMFTNKIKEKQQDYGNQNETIRNLNNELREMKDHLFRNSMNEGKIQEKNRAIKDLQNSIAKVNDQLRKQRANSEKNQKQLLTMHEKYEVDIQQYEDKNKKLKRQVSDLTIKLTNLQNEIVKKDTLISVKDNEIKELTKNIKQEDIQKEMIKSKCDHLQLKIVQLQKEVQQAKKEKDKVIEESRKQLKTLVQLKLQKQQKANSKSISKNEEVHAQVIEQLKQKIHKIEKQNYTLKCDYSQSLQEVNHILIKYRNLQQKYKRKHYHQDKIRQQSNDIEVANIRSQQLQRQNEENKLMINNYQAQIKRLNQILMDKQMGLTRQHSQSALLHPKVFSRYSELRFEKNEKNYFLRKKPEHDEKKNDLYTDRTAKSFCFNNK